MRKTLAFLVFLIAGFMLLAAFAPLPDDPFHRAAAPAVRAIETVGFPQTGTLRPLPVAATSLPQRVTARREVDQRASHEEDKGGTMKHRQVAK